MGLPESKDHSKSGVDAGPYEKPVKSEKVDTSDKGAQAHKRKLGHAPPDSLRPERLLSPPRTGHRLDESGCANESRTKERRTTPTRGQFTSLQASDSTFSE